MRNIIYYVAASLDGFICGPDADISGFVAESDGVNKYLSDLQDFDTVIMGKNTYEFGYKFGLIPGQPAYPNMMNYVFADSLEFDKPHPKLLVKKSTIEEIENLKSIDGPDIYLCGGGLFAGWLFDNHQIDILKIKLNPLVLGQGVRLFGNSKTKCRLDLISMKEYEKGLVIIEYKITY